MKCLWLGTDVLGAVACGAAAGVAFYQREHLMAGVALGGAVCWIVSLALDLRRR